LGVIGKCFAGGGSEALGAGFDLFLGKPFREEELFERMGKLLGLKWVHESPGESSAPREPEDGPVQLPQAVLD